MSTFSTTRALLATERGPVRYHSLRKLAALGYDIGRLPYGIRILLETLLRNRGKHVSDADIAALASWDPAMPESASVPFLPARVLLQDFTGVPVVADLAAMRDAVAGRGGDPSRVNPRIPVDLVIDHSVQVDAFGSQDALAVNMRKEFERNRERYAFLKWGQQAFANLNVVPPGNGIVHQVNLERLATVVRVERSADGAMTAFPDTVIGTDSHTTMINGLGVLGWGVGGIEAEAAALGEPLIMNAPPVVGVRLDGATREGVTATDVALTVTALLRKTGVVGAFVEFFGDGVASLSLPDRATIANMAPEYGATMGFFPADAETLRFLRLTGRSEAHVRFVEEYLRTQDLFMESNAPVPEYSRVVTLDLSSVEPSLAGPKRPQDRVRLADVPASFLAAVGAPVDRRGERVTDGALAIAAITSCTNTSNPSLMIAAGLLARNALERGLTVPSWVKTSFAPGSRAVDAYLERAGLKEPLERLGFATVGYGCTTCIGNSGPLVPEAERAAKDGVTLAAVLSGNRNFEGRVHALVKANYLASPPLVVAYAIAGTVRRDLTAEPVGVGGDGEPVHLREIWPSGEDIAAVMAEAVGAEAFGCGEAASREWESIPAQRSRTYAWDPGSTYVRRPPFFEDRAPLADIRGARAIILAGDSVTTDHISPAGSIASASPAATYLEANDVRFGEFNSYGARRGNHEVMMRGTFANNRFRNLLAPGTEGGITTHVPSGQRMAIYDAAMRYREEGTPLVVIAGKDYGMGSSRDWAAKGVALLGVRAVIFGSVERIHRSNLIGMGVLPLEFADGQSARSLGLEGTESFDIEGIRGGLAPNAALSVAATKADGQQVRFRVTCRIETVREAEILRRGGILLAVTDEMVRSPASV